jgi:hypothetical protein
MYLGVGELGGIPSSKNNKKIKSYTVWGSMLDRCYSDKLRVVHKAYEDCTVCDEWLYYPNFVNWFNDNYKAGMQLDKDLINVGSRTYNPENCSFIPSEINSLVISCKASRGNFPQGCAYHKATGKIIVRVREYGKSIIIGYFDCKKEAFKAYKEKKLMHMIKVANSSFANGDICEQVFNNLIKWDIKYDG